MDPLQRIGTKMADYLMRWFGLSVASIGRLNVWALVGYAGVAVSGIMALWLLWQQRRPGRRRRWDDRLDRLYWQARERAHRQGVPDSTGTTPRRFADQAAEHQPATAETWQTLTTLYERQHYGKDPIGESDIQQAQALVRQLRQAAQGARR